MEKTNAMRILERVGAAYRVHAYAGGALSGTEVAAALGEDAARVFKTLVTVAAPRRYYVFVIPAAAELDLKKAGRSGCRSRRRTKTLPRRSAVRSATSYDERGRHARYPKETSGENGGACRYPACPLLCGDEFDGEHRHVVIGSLGAGDGGGEHVLRERLRIDGL